MTEIKITGGGQPTRSDGAGVDAADSSARAFARAEGSSAPTTGPASQTPNERASGDGPATAHPNPGAAGPAPAAAMAPGKDSHAPATTGADEIEGDLDELVKTAKQRDDYLALAQRTQADFENYRKRVAREAAAARDRGVSSLAKELLPALDNLDRALEAAAEDDPLLQGVRLVRTELKGALARAGIESFCPLGERFDPSLHEAVATAAQPPGGAPSGTVVEVYQDGYRLGEGILRPARVVVSA